MSNPIRFRRLDDELARISLTGQDRVRFLSGMVTCDVKNLSLGSGAYGALLTVKGKVVSDFIVLSRGDLGLWLLVPGAAKQRVWEALDRYIISDDAVLHDECDSLAHLGVYGPGASAFLLGDAAPLSPYHFVDKDGLCIVSCRDLGDDSFQVLGSQDAVAALIEKLQAAGACPLSLAESEVRRVEVGRPKFGIDLDEDRLPQEASIEEALCFTKGCFLGQEVVVRLRDRGQLPRKLVGLRITGDALPPAKAKLRHASRPQAGELTSVVQSARFGVLALGYVHRSIWDMGTQLDVTDEHDESLGQVATVSALPFA